MGASRADIIAHLLVESALLAAVGLVVGLLLTFWGVHFLESRVPPSVAEYVVAPQVSWRVLAAASIASIVCTVFVGLLPAIRVSRVDPNELLKSGAGTGANKKNRRQYGVMVAIEVGLSLAVLSGAAIVVRSAAHLRRDEAALDVRDLSQAWIFIRPPRDTTLSLAALSAEFVARLRPIPDARDVGFIMNRSYVGHALTVDERGGTPHEVPAPMNGPALVSPGYLRTFGRRIVRGRDFLEGVPGEPEVIVDEHTARALAVLVPIRSANVSSSASISLPSHGRASSASFAITRIRAPPIASRTRRRVRREVGEIFYVPSSRDSVTVHGEKGLFVTMLIRARTDPRRPVPRFAVCRKAGSFGSRRSQRSVEAGHGPARLATAIRRRGLRGVCGDGRRPRGVRYLWHRCALGRRTEARARRPYRPRCDAAKRRARGDARRQSRRAVGRRARFMVY